MVKQTRILILEDNPSDFEMVRRELLKSNPAYIMKWSQDKSAFDQALDEFNPDLILLDYSLPGFDGLSALALARQRFADIPAIIVSGAIGEEAAIESLKAGATDYVLKQRMSRIGPVTKRALQEAEHLTERKRAEKALLDSRKRFESLFSSSNEGIGLHELVYDIDGKAIDYRIIDINPAYETIMRISRERAIGALASDLIRKGNPSHLDIYSRVAETGEPASFETYFPSLNRCFRISVFSPDRMQFATSIVDITERKRLEEDLRMRTEELRRSNEDLRQFAYVASHDLQEPLRMVTSYLGLLQKKYGNKLDDMAREYIQFAVQGSKRMRELINDLLQYSRIDNKPMELVPLDMNKVVRNALDSLRPRIIEEKATIQADYLPKISAEPVQMLQLFQNLIGNAIKFHGKEPLQIHISAVKDGGSIVFSVKDNGIGIDPEYSERIFEPFQRLHTREEYHGTGIGLAIAKKIVERHEGRIWVESQLGKGSAFFFRIPISLA